MRALGLLMVFGTSMAVSSLAPAHGQITALLLKPWGPTAWDNLSSSWPTYGSIPVSVSTFGSGTITLAALSAANPDVLVFSDCAGGNNTFTAAEQADITLYLTQGGKRAVTTFAAFQWNTSDNRWLLPLCGLTPNLNLVAVPHGGSAITTVVAQHPLVAGIPPSYVSSGYTDAQFPNDLSWDPADYNGVLVATDSSFQQIVHYYAGANHDAVMISFMPEYSGNAYDTQLIYNALIAVVTNTSVTITPQALPSLGTPMGLSLAAPGFPNTPYLMAFAATPSPGILLSDGRTIPLTPDPIFWLSLTPGNPYFLNTGGVLNSSGNALTWAVVVIPNLPALIGQTIHAAAVTGGTGPTGIGGISPALPITFVP